ncbi:uncharacterized protein LOC129694529 [Leucoraja erinacea]|uniref:uncharacterized protein LOC129694529 n=1 Tax=Leucoraja erinaceus TaxID=7782 RepID=UPI0024548FEB|nr:uncharacterized protein LOC129694529 [Leucoraja erinacea]XP_055487226.1 uncharacterized protein LOC129694529 [Leucoraja erinacea]
MRLATLVLLLVQPMLLGATLTAVREQTKVKLVEEVKAPSNSAQSLLITTTGSTQAAGVQPVIALPAIASNGSALPAIASNGSALPNATSTMVSIIEASDQATVVVAIASSSSSNHSTGRQPTSTQPSSSEYTLLEASAHVVLSNSTRIATGTLNDMAALQTDVPVPVNSGAEIVIINSNGTETESRMPIVLRVGDEIIIAHSETGGNDTSMPIVLGGGGGGAEIIITNSKESENSSLTPIILNKGDEIIVATSNGTNTDSASSLVIGNRSEIKITRSENSNNSVILTNGREIITKHYSDTNALDERVVTAGNENTDNVTVTTPTTPSKITENIVVAKIEEHKFSIVPDKHVTQTVGGNIEITKSPEPQTIVISLDSSSYSWARWSAWYCNCLNSSMSRIRGIMDTKTGITLHSNDYQPSNFQRKPCNYKVCNCSRLDKQCHLNNVTCLDSNPYTCVLSDIAYQEVMDSKDYWKKLKKGVQALYHKIKTFLQRNTKDET